MRLTPAAARVSANWSATVLGMARVSNEVVGSFSPIDLVQSHRSRDPPNGGSPGASEEVRRNLLANRRAARNGGAKAGGHEAIATQELLPRCVGLIDRPLLLEEMRQVLERE